MVTIDQHHHRWLRGAAVAVTATGAEPWRSRSEAFGATERCDRDESKHHFGPGEIGYLDIVPRACEWLAKKRASNGLSSLN